MQNSNLLYQPLDRRAKTMDNKIIDHLEENFQHEFDDLAQGDVASVEEAVKSKMDQLGNCLLQRLLDKQQNGYKGSKLSCSCGCSMKFVGHRPKDIHSLYGWVNIKRAYYHCSNCGRSSYPYDQQSGIGSPRLSPGLAQAAALIAVDDSFEQSSKKLEYLTGQKVSANTIEDVVDIAGSRQISQQDEELENHCHSREYPEPPASPQRLYISLDGTTVHEEDGWHEAKAGCIYFEDRDFNVQKVYSGTFRNSDDFGWHLWYQACKYGLRQAREVVYIGDGASWIKTQHYRHFGRATFIIDWYHASEHIWDCGKQLYGESGSQTEKWVRKRLNWLWDGCTKELLDDLKGQCKRRRGDKRSALEKLIRYISNNEQQMRYDVFRKKGYDIGSGAAEGACKYVVGKRLKQSGMIWSRAGSSAMLALRVTFLNGEWRKLWQSKPLTKAA